MVPSKIFFLIVMNILMETLKRIIIIVWTELEKK